MNPIQFFVLQPRENLPAPHGTQPACSSNQRPPSFQGQEIPGCPPLHFLSGSAL
jgi:hypothetical protein